MNKSALLLLLALAACASGSTPPAPIPPQTYVATNGVLTLTASVAYGAAVTSLIDAHGNQYVNTADHGREFQTAYTLDGLGEAENPTEAGSADDGSGPSSSSVIISASASGNTLSTCVHPAYWRPYNGALVSPDTICKTVTLTGSVLRWDVTITMASPHTESTFEGLTGYGPALPNLYTQQPDGSFLLTPQQSGSAMQYNSPIIEASADGLQALGIYTPNFTITPYMNSPDTDLVGVDKWDCAWWNVWASVTEQTAPTYSYTCYVAVGTLAEVEAALKGLLP